MDNLPNQFFTVESLTTIGAAAFIVYLIVNGLRQFFGLYKKWFVVAVSALIVGSDVFQSPDDLSLQVIVVAVGNIFLLSFTAIGLNEATARGSEAPTASQNSGRRESWVQSWFG